MVVANRGPEVAAVAWIFLTLTWAAASLRFYARAIILKSFGTDDWLVLASLLLFTFYCISALLGVRYGVGKHIADLPPDNIPKAFKWWWVAEIMYTLSTAFLKVGISVSLLRICRQKPQIYIIWSVVVIVVLFSTFFVLLVVFQCSPVSFVWTQFEGKLGKCIPLNLIIGSTYAYAGICVVSDWILGILPIFLLWNLNLNTRTKALAAFILSLGVFGSTVTIVRIPYLQQLEKRADFLISTVDVAIWSTVEPGICIFCAAMACCLPIYRNILSHSRLRGSPPGSGNLGWMQHPLGNDTLRSSSKRIPEIEIYRGLNNMQKDRGTEVTVSQVKRGEDDLKLGSAAWLRIGGRQDLTSNAGSERSESQTAHRDDEDWPLRPPTINWGSIRVETTTEITTSLAQG